MVDSIEHIAFGGEPITVNQIKECNDEANEQCNYITKPKFNHKPNHPINNYESKNVYIV